MPSQTDKIIAALIFGVSFFTAFIGPIIIWIIKRDSHFVDYYGKEYFNFLISYFIYGAIAALLTFVLIGFLLVPVVAIASLVFSIIAIVNAIEGKYYRIPFVIRIFNH